MTSIDTLIHTRSKLTRTELLRELADLSDTGAGSPTSSTPPSTTPRTWNSCSGRQSPRP
ncbi:hypothetical protein [Acrocarpospora corrugata]|uniref:hypothetical protein n=1 Tax=Acrocarpospora corrugata TaxID=35763 RepID=UPI0012D348D4|nr:hypothetical protein [Acrocarpospora corrugata]